MSGQLHLRQLRQALTQLDRHLEQIDRWGARVARALDADGRVLAAGNGGSAAQAQHLTAELVGRYVDERRPLSAIALHADTSALTAIANDYGAAEAFARPVRAHGRPGDVLIAFSTSGRSANVLAAVDAAKPIGLTCLALTGRGPNPLTQIADDAIAIDAETPTVQEVHQVVVHLLCEAIETALRPCDDRALAPATAGRAIGAVR